ncbi:VWA domain-containing protein [Ruegeria halocynthiae]|uniref:VWA domain-containing protein n=1 Tax=Ruegeria halocynthiae TaxID=985054 RepID=UPI00055CB92E|nr:VWA domain-containing protein [Ruegeria halocynthiae]
MFKAFCSALFLALSAHMSFAEDCNPTTLAEGAELKTGIQKLRTKVDKLTSRAEGQIFSIRSLPDSVQEQVPPLPVAPVMPEGILGGDGSLQWSCDADGNPTPTVAEYQEQIDGYEQGVAAYEAEIQSRADAIETLEQTNDTVAADAKPDADDGATTENSEDSGDDAQIAEQAPEDGTAQESQAAPQEADGENSTVELAEETPTTPAQTTPMSAPDNPNLFRRVLSLPSAVMKAEPRDDADESPLPTFSVLYVFDESRANGGDWLKVSTSLREGTQGWVEADQTLRWSNMLVMEFAPKGKRSDVLFFRDDTTLSDIVGSFSYAVEAGEIYESIDTERKRLSGETGSTPNWDQRLVAMEPASGVTFGNQPYLLPILDWRSELFDGTIETNLLKVAAVPADAEEISAEDSNSFDTDLNSAAEQDGVLRVGVVFVVDTTISMRPFIERTQTAIQSFYDSFQQFESASFVSFSLLGFRDEVEQAEGVEYTTKLFQPLDPDAPVEQVLGNLNQMQEANSPTVQFQEDGLAGLIEAIERNDWTPYDARLVVFISDASMRAGEDPLAKFPGHTPSSVAELARNKNIAILPIHLLTPANQRNGNADIARPQYETLAETGDINSEKYFALDATDPDSFLKRMTSLTDQMARAIFDVNAGKVLSVDDVLELEEVPEDDVAAAAVNEIFRAQLESLASVSDGSAPSFLAGWTSDRDLLDPNLETLEVKVFLTRNQLSSLDKQLESIVDAFRSGGDDPQAFFDNLQALAAQTATDPDVVHNNDREAMRAILPSFLQNLPYRSEILYLDLQDWSSLSPASRSEFMEQLDAKRKSYQAVFEQTDLWHDFGSNDPLLQVSPIRLSILP